MAGLLFVLSPYIASGIRAKFGVPVAVLVLTGFRKMAIATKWAAVVSLVTLVLVGSAIGDVRAGGSPTAQTSSTVADRLEKMMRRFNLAQFDGHLGKYLFSGGELLRGESLVPLAYIFVPRGLADKPQASFLNSYGATLQRVFSYMVVGGQSGAIPDYSSNQDVQFYGELWWNFGLAVAIAATIGF